MKEAGRIDIGEQLDALLAKLGVPDKAVVTEVRIGLRNATVLYYPLDGTGHKHLAGDGYPSTRWRTFRVTT